MKNQHFVEDLPMIIPGQFWFKLSKWFQRGSTTETIETKLPRNDHWMFLCIVWAFYADRKSKIVDTAGNRLTLDLMGKCSNAFFSETTNMIKAKLYNVH
jgi:hypothetical protein